MRFHPTLLSFLLCLLLPLHAMADPAFYRINKGNEQHWLLGSIHAGKPSLYPLPDPVERAWQQSRALVMEVDMTHISQEQWQEMGAITRLVDGKTLKDHLPIDLYRRTLIAAGQNGLNESMLAPLRPWFAAITLTQAALARTGYRGEYGVDQHFAKRANDGGKPIVGLETLLEQLGYLASVGDNQTLMLESTLDELPDIQQGFDAVMTAWQNGDEATLINLLRKEMAPPKLQAWLEQTLLAERNRNWVKQWPGLPNESFIVVGALHLYGEQGLLALLEQQGWRITPLTEPAAAN